MTAILDGKNARLLWKLAHAAEATGDGVSGEVFVRIVAPKSKGPRSRKALVAAARQSFRRLRDWGEPHGLSIEKAPAPDEAIDRVVFEPAALLAIALRVRPALRRAMPQTDPATGTIEPRLSRSGFTRNRMEQHATTPTRQKPHEEGEVLDTKGLARMLLVSAWTARDLMRSGAFAVFSVKSSRRVLRSDVLAWVESTKAQPKPKRIKVRSAR